MERPKKCSMSKHNYFGKYLHIFAKIELCKIDQMKYHLNKLNFNNFPIIKGAFILPKGTSLVFNIFHDQFLCVHMQLFRSYFFIIGKPYMVLQYDTQKAQLEQKPKYVANFLDE